MLDSKDIVTPSRTQALLDKYGFNFKKSLGQSFSIDVNIVNSIIGTSDIDAQTGVIEIGPGMGSLTERLTRHTRRVLVFEIDQRLIPVLSDTLSPYDNMTVISEDTLKADIKEAIENHSQDCEKIMVVANLPCYITTPVLLNLMQQDIPIDGYMVIMQKEVGGRLDVEVGSEVYDSLSIVVQYYTETNEVLTVPKSIFMPPPNADPIVVKLMQRTRPLVTVDNEKAFLKLAGAAFAQRRKTIDNSYQDYFKDGGQHKEVILQWLEQAGIDPGRHGETLSIQDLAKLYKKKKKPPQLEN